MIPPSELAPLLYGCFVETEPTPVVAVSRLVAIAGSDATTLAADGNTAQQPITKIAEFYKSAIAFGSIKQWMN